MTRKQASTLLPVTSNHQLMIQTAIKTRQRRHHGGITTAAAMSDVNLKTKVRTCKILQLLLDALLLKFAMMQDKLLECAAHGQTGDFHVVAES